MGPFFGEFLHQSANLPSYAPPGLNAADLSAYWAGVSAWAAWLGLLSLPINGLGLYFVWRQLRANERAVVASGKSAEAAANAARIATLSSRPWMKLTVGTARMYRRDGLTMSLPVSAENVGQTPAIGVLIIARSLDDGDDDFPWDTMKPNPDVGVVAFPGETITANHSVWLDPARSDPNRRIKVTVYYRSSDASIQNETSKVFSAIRGPAVSVADRVYPEHATEWVVHLDQHIAGPHATA